MKKSILVVGGTDGIGKAVALGMAAEGYSVTVIGRSRPKGEQVLNLLRTLYPEGSHHFLAADVSRLGSLPPLVAGIQSLGQAYEVILHSADVLKTAREETAEGLEVCIATNFYARVLLNALLVEQGESPPKRVIHVAAAGFPPGKAFRRNFPIPKTASSFRGHGIGQIANDFYGLYCAGQWRSRNVKVNILNPGIVDTDIRRNSSFPKWFMRLEPVIGFLMRPITQTPEQYARIVTAIALGSNPAADSAVLINARGKPITPSRYLLDEQTQQYVVGAAREEINATLHGEVI
jgi:NAD(P)-dependent dehydrogenase (short-subunit alcohol dehydrogenase family)